MESYTIALAGLLFVGMLYILFIVFRKSQWGTASSNTKPGGPDQPMKFTVV